MSEAKPTPILPARGRKTCPVCDQASYSREGIHPQCAIQQSDAPRQKKLAAAKKQAAAKKKKPRQKSWNKKCPKCHVEVHVRRKECDCGHAFERS
jgi:hypothetical protein